MAAPGGRLGTTSTKGQSRGGLQAQCSARNIHLDQALAINNIKNIILAIIVHLAYLTIGHGTGGALELNSGTSEQPMRPWATLRQ